MIIKPNIFDSSLVKSLQTTRLSNSNLLPNNDLNLNVFDSDKHVLKNLEQLTHANKLPHLPVFLKQVHSNTVVEYNSIPTEHGFHKADACLTTKKGIVCAILTADCLPVLITDTKATVVAAVHCGWRGLYADILEETIHKMNKEPSDLQCWLGPCISYKPYRVDEQFRQHFTSKNKDFVHSFYLDKKNNWHADLKKMAMTQLNTLGVTQIAQTPYCTYDNKNLFYSYRRDKETGRMASLIWLNN